MFDPRYDETPLPFPVPLGSFIAPEVPAIHRSSAAIHAAQERAPTTTTTGLIRFISLGFFCFALLLPKTFNPRALATVLREAQPVAAELATETVAAFDAASEIVALVALEVLPP